MSQKPQVRIVKRARPGEAEPAAEPRAASEKESRKESRRGARVVAEKVSSWVEEFRERRTADDVRTFDSLFAGRAA